IMDLIKDSYFNDDEIVIGENKLFRTMWNTSSDHMFIVKKRFDGVYINEKINPALEKTFNIKSNFLQNRALKDFLDDKIYLEVLKHYDECIEKNQPITYEERYSIDEKGDRFWLTTILPMSCSKDGSYRIFGVAKEITDIHKAQETLEKHNEILEKKVQEKTKTLLELNKELDKKIKIEVEKNIKSKFALIKKEKFAQMGAMIANIAHQWKQPLNLISILATKTQMEIESSFLDKNKILKNMEDINQKVQYLSNSINTFRNLLKEKKERKKVAIEDRIQLALDVISIALKDNFITLINNIDYSQKTYIYMIMGELTEVVINIINNAKDALIENSVQEPWIKLDMIKDEKNVFITIEDNGGGIDDEILPKIFDKYFTTKDEDSGTGLGLSMSSKIIQDNLNGTLDVQNTAFGAKFTITIPLKQ
ncbi:MAG: PAS domain S-box protein, partial [Campylobacterales bacterium]|nr:PAS domain S-box protein [Campylobacterales bacterium]